jgi:GT2 family glycosyltransferase
VGKAVTTYVGVASYENPTKFQTAVAHILSYTTGDVNLYIVDNNSQDSQVRRLLDGYENDSRITVQRRTDNIGYAGAVNEILAWADSLNVPWVYYSDNDTEIQTQGWNNLLDRYMAENHDVAMVFPNGGFYEIQRQKYTEIQWGLGFFWGLKLARYREIGGMDTSIGHQEEADLALRLRLAGWRLAAAREVVVRHHASATTNPASQERINQGVINFVNKWCRYFCGPNVNYYSPNVLRWEDWTPNALYLEEFLQSEFAGLNDEPESRFSSKLGREVDLCKVPRWSHLYRGRII